MKSFKKQAARGPGPDGFSKQDLANMPTEFMTDNTTSVDWPRQLAFGTVIGLGKVDDAHEEGHFRPILRALQKLVEDTNQTTDSSDGPAYA